MTHDSNSDTPAAASFLRSLCRNLTPEQRANYSRRARELTEQREALAAMRHAGTGAARHPFTVSIGIAWALLFAAVVCGSVALLTGWEASCDFALASALFLSGSAGAALCAAAIFRRASK